MTRNTKIAIVLGAGAAVAGVIWWLGRHKRAKFLPAPAPGRGAPAYAPGSGGGGAAAPGGAAPRTYVPTLPAKPRPTDEPPAAARAVVLPPTINVQPTSPTRTPGAALPGEPAIDNRNRKVNPLAHEDLPLRPSTTRRPGDIDWAPLLSPTERVLFDAISGALQGDAIPLDLDRDDSPGGATMAPGTSLDVEQMGGALFKPGLTFLGPSARFGQDRSAPARPISNPADAPAPSQAAYLPPEPEAPPPAEAPPSAGGYDYDPATERNDDGGYGDPDERTDGWYYSAPSPAPAPAPAPEPEPPPPPNRPRSIPREF